MTETRIHLPRNLRQSELQKRILIYLSKSPEKSITAIATSVGSSRPSVSRSLHKLEKAGRIWKDLETGYRLTVFGKEESREIEIVKPALGVKIRWWDASMGFDCTCGNIDIVITDESGDKACECGRVYRFTSKLEIVMSGKNE